MNDFKSEFIFIWINSFTSEISSIFKFNGNSRSFAFNHLAMLISRSTMIYFPVWSRKNLGFPLHWSHEHANRMFVCCLDGVIYLWFVDFQHWTDKYMLLLEKKECRSVHEFTSLLPFQKLNVQKNNAWRCTFCVSGFLLLTVFTRAFQRTENQQHSFKQ